MVSWAGWVEMSQQGVLHPWVSRAELQACLELLPVLVLYLEVTWTFHRVCTIFSAGCLGHGRGYVQPSSDSSMP